MKIFRSGTIVALVPLYWGTPHESDIIVLLVGRSSLSFGDLPVGTFCVRIGEAGALFNFFHILMAPDGRLFLGNPDLFEEVL